MVPSGLPNTWLTVLLNQYSAGLILHLVWWVLVKVAKIFLAESTSFGAPDGKTPSQEKMWDLFHWSRRWQRSQIAATNFTTAGMTTPGGPCSNTSIRPTIACPPHSLQSLSSTTRSSWRPNEKRSPLGESPWATPSPPFSSSLKSSNLRNRCVTMPDSQTKHEDLCKIYIRVLKAHNLDYLSLLKDYNLNKVFSP